MDCGFNKLVAEDICAYINKTGGILQECGIDDATRLLINPLHPRACFVAGSRLGDDWFNLPTIVSRRSGRQGCRLGAVVFNFVFLLIYILCAFIFC